MSASETTEMVSVPDVVREPGHVARWWRECDAWVERLGDRLNPILVKEARQALKSRQFLVTFSLLLFCGVAWSFIAVSFTRDASRLPQAGGMAFAGYFVVLTVPLLIIIPYSTFQSLADERHEGTFDLLSITSLSSRQIVLGKLASSLLQMMVYYSALAPCMAFTYLLPGIDILTMLVLLAQVFCLSVLLSCTALLLAALTRESSLQVIISAGLVVILVIITWSWLAYSVMTYLDAGASPVGQRDFWTLHLALLMFAVSFMVLFLEATASRLRFASANRSTSLRWIMLGQQGLLVGWMAVFLQWDPPRDIWFALFTIGGGYWAVMGLMLTAELGELSPRAQRDLPRTALGVVCLTWFNPGSGTGYVFALLNMLLLIEFGWITMVANPTVQFSSLADETYGLAILGYLTLFLGVGRLTILGLRRFVLVPFTSAVFLQALIVLGAAGVPFMVMTVMDWESQTYQSYHASNWVWTLSEVSRYSGVWSGELVIALALVGSAAVVVFIVNVWFMADEVTRVRAATPRRVLEE